MRILVIGDGGNLAECRDKFGSSHDYELISGKTTVSGTIDVIFDFVPGGTPGRYNNVSGIPIFIDASKSSVGAMCTNLKVEGTAFGFPGLPGFLKREILEVSVRNAADESALARVCRQLGTTHQIVADIAGLVTPRVICMIINEAYFACEDQTASREDIDLAMKLGTAYPFGPFEWCKIIGARNVCEVLRAVERETGNIRYAISKLLQAESRQNP